jgi:2,3-bisphosphoglycerate-independent phosphoglycerate mutase
MEKVIFIVCDGLSDRPIPELGRKTPLEAASTPNLDRLVKEGISGVMNTIEIGVRPGSDVAHLSLFGYDPNVYYTGRGPYEVAGVGMDLKEGDVAFRANMGTVDENMVVLDRRAGRIDSTEEFEKLFNGTIIDGVEFQLKKGTGHRIGLLIRGKGISDKISDGDPHKINVKIHEILPLDSSDEAKFTAGVLNKFLKQTHEVLKELASNKERKKNNLPEANYILIRGPGKLPKLPSFKEKYGLDAVCIAGAGLYKGIARILGMDVLDVEGATGKPDTNIHNKIKKVIENFDKYNFFFVHIKAADSLGEDGNYQGKMEFIEKIDKALPPLFSLKNTLIVVTADHTTACTLKAHTADDVPLVIHGAEVRDDDVEMFGERSCAKGRLGHIRGLNLMPIIIDLMGLAQLFGA